MNAQTNKVEQMKGRYIVFPAGNLTSLDENPIIVRNGSEDVAAITLTWNHIYRAEVNNRYDVACETISELVDWMNKEGFTVLVGVE
jgi:hypothetical protein